MDFDKQFNKAQTLAEEGDPKGAIEILESLYKYEPEKNRTLVQIALICMENEMHSDALEYCDKYLNKIPHNEKELDSDDIYYSLNHWMGIAYANLEKNELAIECFKKAISYQDKPISFAYAGQVYWDMGHEKQAISFWRTAARNGNKLAMLALNTRGVDF